MVEAFPVHEIDQVKGRATADQMIAKLEQLNAPAEMLERYIARRQQAISCYLSDDGSDDGYLHFTLWPNEPIFIDYHSPRHEERSRPLLERLATALGYEIQAQSGGESGPV
jgi:hypothetical protein